MTERKMPGAAVRVKIPVDPDYAAEQAAKPASLNQVFGQPLVRAAAPLVSMLAAAPAALASLATQEGRVKIRSGGDTIMGRPYGGEKVPVEPVQEAMQQGRAAPAGGGVVPADRQSQMIAAILGSGLTVNEAASVTGMLPAATGKAPTAKDTVMTQAAQLSEALYQSQLKQAAELAKTDPVGAKALEYKATEQHFNRQAGLTGFNPLQLATAERMGVEE